MTRRLPALLPVDARDILPRSEAPIVYLASSRDVVVPRWNVDEIALRARDARHVIDGPRMAFVGLDNVEGVTLLGG